MTFRTQTLLFAAAFTGSHVIPLGLAATAGPSLGLSIGGAVVGAGLAAVLVAVSQTRMSKPIEALQARFEALTNVTPDLTERVEETGTTEMVELAQSINQFSSNMQRMILRLRVTAEEVASGARQIKASNRDLTNGSADQASSLGSISAAVQELSASADGVADKSQTAAQTAEEAGRVADESGRTLRAIVEDVQAVQTAVQAASEVVRRLGERGEEIGQVIAVINDIADQTNLLALNAAIEAARAGEHGRGFAVVADEVRKLADRTTKATQEIAQSITAIQSETQEAYSRMEGGSTQIERGVVTATEAGARMQQILEGSSRVQEMVASIAATALEQSSATSAIERSLESATGLIGNLLEHAESTSQSAEDLNARAIEIDEMAQSHRI